MRTLPRFLIGVAGALCAVATLPAQSRPAPVLVDAAWVQRHLADTSVVLLHVVTDMAEYEAGHVPGSVPVPISSIAIPSGDTLRAELPAVPVLVERLEALGVADGRTIVVIGVPVPAARVAFTLATLGLEGRIRILDGGVEQWREWVASRGGQATLVSRTAGTPRVRGRLTPAPRPELVATIADVKAAIADTSAGRPRVLDARAVEFYSGASAGGMARAGHIPTAGSVPLTGLAGVNGLLRPSREVRALVARAGAGQPSRGPVITYCHIGMQASLLWLQARLAGYDARLFDGSWQAWARDASLPIEGGSSRP